MIASDRRFGMADDLGNATMADMRLDPRFLNWGVFFILLGAIPLAVSQGWITGDAINGWWRFWPLILIGIGVGLLLRRTTFHFVGGLIVAVTFGLMLGSLLAGGVAGGIGIGWNCSPGRGGTAFTSQSGTLGTNGSVSVEMSCGDLVANATAGTTWTLSGTSPNGQPPRVEASADRLSIRPQQRDFLTSFDSPGENWTVGLPTDPTLDLSATLNAGSARFSLGGMHLRDLSLTTNAGSTVVDLTGASLPSFSWTVNAGSSKITLPAASMTGSATVNAGSLAICVPPGAGVRIQSSSFLASNNFGERDLIQTGSTWTSSGYAGAPVQIDLSISANAGSVELNPSGGCS
jgi:LiaF transmembrane domain